MAIDIEVSEVYEYGDAGDWVISARSTEKAMMATIANEKFITIHGIVDTEALGRHLDDKTIVKKCWGVYVDGELYRSTKTKLEAYEAASDFEKAIDQIKKLNDGESISFSPLFTYFPNKYQKSSVINKIKL